MTFRDLREVEIKPDDLVSFIYRWGKARKLCHGKVIGFTTSMVKVEFNSHGRDRVGNYMAHNLCVIQQKEA